MGAFRWDLAIRGVVLVVAATWLGIAVFEHPESTGAAVLAGLLLLLADFHGDPWRRARAYVLTAIVGAALVGLAAAMGALPTWAFACGIAVLTALIMLLRSTGGMFAAAGTCLVADVVVGAANGIGQVAPGRVTLGALLGGLLATLLAFTIKPAPWISPVRQATIDALGHCEDVLRGAGSASALALAPRQLIAVYLARPERPSAPVPTAQASVDLLSDLTFLSEILASTPAATIPPGLGPAAPPGAPIGYAPSSDADLVERSRQLLTHPGPARRADVAQALAHTPVSATPPPDFVSNAIAAAVAGIADHALEMTDTGRSGIRGSWRAVVADIRVRLTPRSTLARTAFASGLLFGVLVATAELLRIDHPQWLLLVAVSSFYPHVRRTVTKATATVLGTLSGGLALWGLLTVLAPQSPWWWLVLVLATALAMGAPHSSAGVVVGQGAFTLVSLTLLQIATVRTGSGSGISAGTAAERLIDVALGVAAAVAVSVLLAPRNLPRHLREAIAALLDTAAAATARVVLESPDQAAGTIARSQFLRCVDVAGLMATSDKWPQAQLIDWIDAARLAGQTFVVATLVRRDGADAPSPLWQQATLAYQTQAAALRRGTTSRRPAEGSGELATLAGQPLARPLAAQWVLRNAAIQADELAGLIDA